MRHLTSGELVDLAEGVRARSLEPHLDACEACRRQLADLGDIMAAAAELHASEPSPLFWDHFSGRVREAVAAEGPPRRAWWFGWRSSPRLAIPLAAVLALLTIAALVTMRVGPSRDRAEPVTSASPDTPAVAGVDMSEAFKDDPSLLWVADLAANAHMDWDAASEAGLISNLGTAEWAVGQLSTGERLELDRLLKEALTKPGA